MLQAIGLTSAPRRDRPPAVDDLTFEAPTGAVTALVGPPGSGKTTALRRLLELDPGRGLTYFRGRPLRRIAQPAREVGVVLGDVPGHPSRTVRGQLRMLAAGAGVPVARADAVIRDVGLGGLEGARLGTLPRGADRRLALAAALLGEPHTLLLDAPGAGLSPAERLRLHELLRAHAEAGGTVLYTTRDPKDAARNADHIVALDGGRLVAAQEAGDFARTRLRPRVAVRTPHAARLAAAVTQEARAARRPVEVDTEDGTHLLVYGGDCAQVGDTAFRHGVPVHRLVEETGDDGPAPVATGPVGRPAEGAPAPLPRARRPVRSPLRPLRYELRRITGVPSTGLILTGTLAVSAVLAVLLGRGGGTPLPAVLAAWPELLPLPPAALGAGLIGALAFGEEYRYPALAAGRGAVPRRLALLLAKLAVSAGAALLLGALVAGADLAALRLFYGPELIAVPDNWTSLGASWLGLSVGCAWAGVLGAGVFRAAAAGVAAVLFVPVAFVPLLRQVMSGPAVRSVAGLPARLGEFAGPRWAPPLDRWISGVLEVVAQPAGVALALTLTVLLCTYVLTGLRRQARW
ncbi:ATP-binding cassette domain-containing protein [Streptomyces sp. R302]|uniref:ATP-binding cassette domain-containing protein n=1 Tax=unclassified Streptomyces TaxID=2593676 RepID=UPI00145F8AB3|nr:MULTISPECIES: ATP-binding cassette domain-containing protein [unclassified Streptomyces]NML54176.1 ATP-binding cassette domain-containing protein [Streptomyces sp. R301]NML83436.1 ATP-binding cassette domain-containing protein [Streptomyces sp. R302]